MRREKTSHDLCEVQFMYGSVSFRTAVPGHDHLSSHGHSLLSSGVPGVPDSVLRTQVGSWGSYPLSSPVPTECTAGEVPGSRGRHDRPSLDPL